MVPLNPNGDAGDGPRTAGADADVGIEYSVAPVANRLIIRLRAASAGRL